MFEDRLIGRNHVGLLSRIIVEYDDGTNEAFVVSYNRNFTVSIEFLESVESAEQLCTNYASYLKPSMISVSVDGESCAPTVSEVTFANADMVSFTVENCFSAKKSFTQAFSTVVARFTPVDDLVVGDEEKSTFSVRIMNVDFQQVSAVNFSLFDTSRTTELSGDEFSVEQTGSEAEAEVYQVVYPTKKLRAGVVYTLQFQGYDKCGKLQSARAEVRYVRSHHRVAVRASCVRENECAYYFSENLTRRMGTLPDAQLTLEYAPLGYSFNVGLTGCVFGVAKIAKNEVVLGKRYSASVSSPSAVSDAALELLEGMTVEFWDATGFTIAARSARACTADPAGMAVRAEWVSQDAQNLSTMVASDEGSAIVKVEAKNAAEVELEVRTSAGTVVGRFSGALSATSAGILTGELSFDASGLRSGEYEIWAGYASACGERVSESVGLVLRVPYRVSAVCASGGCEADLSAFLDWTGASAAPLGVFGLSEFCSG